MPKKKKLTHIEEWLNGAVHFFHAGDVVRLKHNTNVIGVVGAPNHEYGHYDVKIPVGKFDYIWQDVSHKHMIKVDEESPFKNIDMYQRFPGPSTAMMKKIDEDWRKRKIEIEKTKTSRDVDKYVESLEETIAREHEEETEKDVEKVEDEVLETVNEDAVIEEIINPDIIKELVGKPEDVEEELF